MEYLRLRDKEIFLMILDDNSRSCGRIFMNIWDGWISH